MNDLPTGPEASYLKKCSLLCIEDDEMVRECIVSALKPLVGEVIEAPDGESGWKMFLTHRPELILADIMMPVLSGIEFAKRLRALDEQCILVFMTAVLTRENLTEVIHLRPDGFLEKPFELSELLTLLRKMASRQTRSRTGIIGRLEVDLENARVFTGDLEIPLTVLENRLLSLLMNERGEVVRYERIEKEVWSQKMTESSLKSLIYRLRQKLGKQWIKSRSGIGVMLVHEQNYGSLKG